MNPTRIAHITDLHIAPEGEKPYEADTRQTFLKITEALKSESHDYIVISGDLSYRDGDKQTYQWIKEKMDELSNEYYIISGNHDENEALKNVFPDQLSADDGEIYYYKLLKSNPAIFLDTSKGWMSEKQIIWFREHLLTEEHQLTIFMHHPPAFGRIPHMDKHFAFQQINEMQLLFKSFRGNINIFCGHYHIEKSIASPHFNVFITPSPFFNIKHEVEEFAIDNFQVAYRDIVLDNHMLYTKVNYI